MTDSLLDKSRSELLFPDNNSCHTRRTPTSTSSSTIMSSSATLSLSKRGKSSKLSNFSIEKIIHKEHDDHSDHISIPFSTITSSSSAAPSLQTGVNTRSEDRSSGSLHHHHPLHYTFAGSDLNLQKSSRVSDEEMITGIRSAAGSAGSALILQHQLLTDIHRNQIMRSSAIDTTPSLRSPQHSFSGGNMMMSEASSTAAINSLIYKAYFQSLLHATQNSHPEETSSPTGLTLDQLDQLRLYNLLLHPASLARATGSSSSSLYHVAPDARQHTSTPPVEPRPHHQHSNIDVLDDSAAPLLSSSSSLSSCLTHFASGGSDCFASRALQHQAAASNLLNRVVLKPQPIFPVSKFIQESSSGISITSPPSKSSSSASSSGDLNETSETGVNNSSLDHNTSCRGANATGWISRSDPDQEPLVESSGCPDVTTSGNSSSSGGAASVANNKPKIFTCNECGKTFNAHYNLTRHMPVHTGARPFICKVCGKGLWQSSSSLKSIRMNRNLIGSCCHSFDYLTNRISTGEYSLPTQDHSYTGKTSQMFYLWQVLQSQFDPQYSHSDP